MHHDNASDAYEQRSFERRRWFEHVVVLPVSLGMVVTFVLYVGRDLLVHLGGQAWLVAKSSDVVLFVTACVISLVAVRWMRR